MRIPNRSRHSRSAILTCLAIIVLSVWTGPVAAQAIVEPGTVLNVVILGDDYISGTGAGGYYDRKCWRSNEAWSQTYAQSLEDEGFNVRLVNLACSGSVKTDVDQQLLENANVVANADLILLSVGGNDVAFSDIVSSCFNPVIRDASNCRQRVEEANRLLSDGTIEQSLRNLISDVSRHNSKGAPIVLVGYPSLVRSTADGEYSPYTLVTTKSCVVETVEYPCEAIRYDAAGGASQLSVLTDNVQSLQSANFVSARELFATHEPDPRALAVNNARWIHEFETTLGTWWQPYLADRVRPSADSYDRIRGVANESYHYNLTGHEQLANSLLSRGAFGATAEVIGAIDTAIDLMLIVDTSSSMEDEIDPVKRYLDEVILTVTSTSSSARIGLATYRDDPAYTGDSGDYAAQLEVGLTTDYSTVESRLDALPIYGGGDVPETVLSGVMTALDQEWRDGVKKMAIVIGDGPAHDPEPISGLTAADVIRESISIDPVAIYVLSTGSSPDLGLAEVAEATDGGIIPVGGSEAFISKLEKMISAAPSAWVGQGYVGIPRKPVLFNASGSYGMGTALTSYEWDIDGDGSFDSTTQVPRFAATYESEFSGFVQLRVTDSEGRTSLASAPVVIDRDGDGVPSSEDNCADDSNAAQIDSDADGVGDVCDTEFDDEVVPTSVFEVVGSQPVVTVSDISGGDGVALATHATASDADDDINRYEWNASEECTIANPSALNTTLTCPQGTWYVALSVFDSEGSIGSDTAVVKVGMDDPVTPTPTAAPTTEATPTPTTEPTPNPTATPTTAATPNPTASPTTEATPNPTIEPTPTTEATPNPTASPTTEATPNPTSEPTPIVVLPPVLPPESSETVSRVITAVDQSGTDAAPTRPAVRPSPGGSGLAITGSGATHTLFVATWLLGLGSIMLGQGMRRRSKRP